jgi:hypothetical protein
MREEGHQGTQMKQQRHPAEADDNYRERILAKIGIYEIPAVYEKGPRKVTLSALALDLLERKDREIRAEQAIKERVPTNATVVMPHAFRPKIVKELSESCTADFERIEKDYHGVQRTVEAITRCNQHHGLDALIKRRA